MAAMTPENRRRRVAELREQGMSFRAIGRQLGISHELARRDARAVGLTVLTVVPAGLKSRGQAFWDHATSVFELDRHEQEVVTQVCRLLDVCDALQKQVDADGVTVLSVRGEVKTHPALVELRQASLAVGRLLAQLDIPAEEEGSTTLRSGFSSRSRQAARRRWGTAGESA